MARGEIVTSHGAVLLNPEHPDYGQVQIGTPRELAFDPRMWK